MMRFLLPAALAVTLLTGPAMADYRMLGAGGVSCGTWTADRRQPPGSQILSHVNGEWVLGFLSGVGSRGSQDPLRGVDADGVWAWVDNYCQVHPLQEVVEAATAFVREHPQ